jgi:hypothetical protein
MLQFAASSLDGSLEGERPARQPQTQTWGEFTNKDVGREVFPSDYKKKDGRLYFNKMVIKREGKNLLEEEFSDQKTSEKLDPKLFAKPG